MFRNANINADVLFWDVLPIDSAIFQRFSDAVDRQTARARPTPKFAARLVLQDVAVADAGKRLAKITDFVGNYPALSGEQRTPKFV